MAKLATGVQVVVGTPGRVSDMINRNAMDTQKIKMFVLDEADEMLSRGFKDQIYEVFKFMPQDIQVILLSATMPQDVLEVTTRFMRDPVRILVKKEELTLEGIRQFYINVQKEVRISYFPITVTTYVGMEVRHVGRSLRVALRQLRRHLLQHPPQGRGACRPAHASQVHRQQHG